jgi:hypothetical protein
MYACHLIVIKLTAPCFRLVSVALPAALGRLGAALDRHTAALPLVDILLPCPW